MRDYPDFVLSAEFTREVRKALGIPEPATFSYAALKPLLVKLEESYLYGTAPKGIVPKGIPSDDSLLDG